MLNFCWKLLQQTVQTGYFPYHLVTSEINLCLSEDNQKVASEKIVEKLKDLKKDARQELNKVYHRQFTEVTTEKGTLKLQVEEFIKNQPAASEKDRDCLCLEDNDDTSLRLQKCPHEWHRNCLTTAWNYQLRSKNFLCPYTCYDYKKEINQTALSMEESKDDQQQDQGQLIVSAKSKPGIVKIYTDAPVHIPLGNVGTAASSTVKELN